MTQAIASLWSRVSIAPMMDITDRFFRYALRRINPHIKLYSEMVVAQSILRGDRDRFLRYDPSEHPLALQIGTDNPQHAAECARLARDYGYDEINLNVGCPSDRVKSGNFGACLMQTPELVGEIVAAMKGTGLMTSVKCRCGVIDSHRGKSYEFGKYDTYQKLQQFAQIMFASGCDLLIVHARSAILGKLSPKENREIPPLRYDDVYRLQKDFPDRIIELNGGIKTKEEMDLHLQRVPRIMIGRQAQATPLFFSTEPSLSAFDLIRDVLEYAVRDIAITKRELKPTYILRNTMGLFHGKPGSRKWRNWFSTAARQCSVKEFLNEMEKLSADQRSSME